MQLLVTWIDVASLFEFSREWCACHQKGMQFWFPPSPRLIHFHSSSRHVWFAVPVTCPEITASALLTSFATTKILLKLGAAF